MNKDKLIKIFEKIIVEWDEDEYFIELMQK